VFTGIVREVGVVISTVEAAGGRSLVVRAAVTAAGCAVGDSVALDGCCLTATAVAGDKLSFNAVFETITRTTLGALAAGDGVNVEPALRAGDPLGGHYVQGHVDGVGHVESVEAEGDGWRVAVRAPDQVLRYCVEKGSITMDGVSLTVAALTDQAFAVVLVPHTLKATTLSDLVPGQAVNLEVDVLAKYVERLLGH
jgi:riboflavin synthase